MPFVQDIIFTDDLQIVNGDWQVANSDDQHIEHIFLADRGHFRQHPLIGIGILRAQNGPTDVQALKQQIRTQLRSDNYTVRTIKIDGSMNIQIDAERIV